MDACRYFCSLRDGIVEFVGWLLLDLVLRAGKDGLDVGWSEMGNKGINFSRVLCKWTCCGGDIFFGWDDDESCRCWLRRGMDALDLGKKVRREGRGKG